MKSKSKLKGNLGLIIFFILLEFTTILNLWNENIYRRVFHHILNSIYQVKKKPWIIFPNIELYNNEIEYLKSICKNSKKDNNINTHKLFSLFEIIGGHYSNKSSLYYNDFDRETQKHLDKIGIRLKNYYENIIGKKLYLGTSNFRCCILRYEGIDSNFNYHYDTEEKNCYRCIFLLHKKGNISSFSYYDENSNKIDKQLEVGKGLFFKGTTTYHGVDPNNDPTSERYVVGWQFTTDPELKKKSLCSELRDKNIFDILKIFIIKLIIINILIYFFSKYICNINIPLKFIIIITIIISIISLKLPNLLPKSIGTSLNTSPSTLFFFLLLCLLSSIVNPINGLILYNYILITEMLLPNSIVGINL